MSGHLIDTPFAAAQKIASDCITALPVIVLGSGASAAHGMPTMPKLRDCLVATPLPPGLPSQDYLTWTAFLGKVATVDLETALTEVRLNDRLTRHVAETTWNLLTPADIAVFHKVILDRQSLPLTRLFQHLLATTHTEIDVVSTNYDRLAEYAADAGDLCHSTGFGFGHLRNRAADAPFGITQGGKKARTVRIWKVHGSLDWFRDLDNITIGLPITSDYPARLVPDIVTPGIEKFRLTGHEPFRSIQDGADKALQSAGAYLCIGYGFNDEHVQEKLVRRCADPRIPLVLLTKKLTDAATAFLSGGRCKNYLALVELSGPVPGTRMFSPDYPFPDGVEIFGRHIWRLTDFLDMAM